MSIPVSLIRRSQASPPGRAHVTAAGLAAIALAVLAAAPAASASTHQSTGSHKTTKASTKPSATKPPAISPPTKSPALWATVDVCATPKQPYTVGIRGSMPGDGQHGDTMYMSFSVQYLDATTGVWTDVPNGEASHFQDVGTATQTRQAGQSFQFQPTPESPAYKLRGVVAFQWRQGSKVLYNATRPTSISHKSLAGAEPTGFSAATCTIS